MAYLRDLERQIFPEYWTTKKYLIKSVLFDLQPICKVSQTCVSLWLIGELLPLPDLPLKRHIIEVSDYLTKKECS